jgi:HJR/Mrr/RecB family endonuclease
MFTLAQIETLKQQLAQVSTDLADVKNRAWEAKKTLWGAKLRARYYRGSLALRAPASKYSMWKTGVVVVGPVAAMLMVFILSVIVGLPGGLIFWLVILSAIVTFAVLSLMLSYPATAVLPKLIADERFLANEFHEKASQLALEVSTLRKHVVATKAAIQELLDADHRKRELLLKQNWKAMRGEEWRSFVGEVFATLGAEVETPAAAAGPAIDYVVTYGDVRISVLARGSVVAVTNKDVQVAVAARAHYQCDRATVITNSRLARSAEEEAQNTGCFLIGVKEFPSFVMGSNLELFR